MSDSPEELKSKLCDNIIDLDANVSYKRLNLTVAEKMRILHKYDTDFSHLSQRVAGDKLGLPQSTLFRILKYRDEIQTDFRTDGIKTSRKRRRESKCHTVDIALYEWYKQASIHKLPLTRKILKKKATEIGIKLNQDFQTSDGWLTRWLDRHGIDLNVPFREQSDVDCKSEPEDEDVIEEVILEWASTSSDYEANIDLETEVAANQKSNSKPNHEKIKLEYYGMDDDTDDDDFLPPSSKKKDRKAKYSHSRKSANSEHTPKKPAGPTQASINARIDVDNEFELFGKSMAVQLKKMPLDRALICQEKLQQIMTQERLTQMTQQQNKAGDAAADGNNLQSL